MASKEESVYNIPTPIVSIGCQDLLEQNCTYCGWLRKRRALTLFSWPQTYVVIYDGCLYYFKHERAKSQCGRFSLYGYNAVLRASEIPLKEAPWCFKIVHSHKEFRTYYFSASSEQEMKSWMSKTKSEMLRANEKSASYGRNLQRVKVDKRDLELEDPSFYQHIEQNIYDDSSKFIPGLDYQKKCSIKCEDEESDEEVDSVLPVVNPDIENRPPIPLPHDQGPFITFKTPSFECDPPNASEVPKKATLLLPSKVKAVSKVDIPPATPPRPRRELPSLPTDDQMDLMTTKHNSNKSTDLVLTGRGLQPPTNRNRRGSYEKTEDPDSNTSQTPNINPSSSGGGSTGDDEQSDMEDDWADFYFALQDKQQAHDIIQNIGEDGVYMVRPENTGRGKVLVVYAEENIKKYRIKHENGKYFLAKEGYHDSDLESLLKHYYYNNLPTVEVKLKIPFKQHPKYRFVST